MRIQIHFDITFHKLACPLVTIDVMSQSGESQDGIQDDVFKRRLDSQGKSIDGAKTEKQGTENQRGERGRNRKRKGTVEGSGAKKIRRKAQNTGA